MTSMEEYQWRYRRPAPSLHEAFAEMAAGRCDQWCRRRRFFRRAVVTLAGLLLLGLAPSVVSWRAAHADGHICYSSPTRAEAWCRNFDTPNDACTISTLG